MQTEENLENYMQNNISTELSSSNSVEVETQSPLLEKESIVEEKIENKKSFWQRHSVKIVTFLVFVLKIASKIK